MRTRPVQYCTVPGCTEEAIAAVVTLEPHRVADKLCVAHLTLVRRFVAEQLAQIALGARTVHPGEEPLGIIDRLRGFVSQT